MRGKQHTDSTKQKLSELMKERHANGTAPVMTDTVKKSISASKTGSVYKSRPLKSAEHRKKISEAIRKKWAERNASN